MSYEVDPTNGPHAAANLSDEELDYLHRIVSLELAIRMSSESYQRHFHEIAAAREAAEEMVGQLREDRERMRFVTEVQADLARLPLTTDSGGSETRRLYL